MFASTALSLPLLARARADQVATLYAQWHRTTVSMVLGATILCFVLWDEAAHAAMLAWVIAILANQGWRGLLARAYQRLAPTAIDASRWGRYWAIGSTFAGALWGTAAVAMFPASPAHQALVIVCLFGVILGGLNLTAVYRPAFYGFVLPALIPLIARVAAEGDRVHLFTALVMTVVLAFVVAYGHHLNALLTQSLAMRYENADLVDELKAQTAAAEAARNAAEAANRAKSQFLAAASHDLRQPLHAMGLFAAALSVKVRDPAVQPMVASINASVEALERLFGQLLDLSRLDAGVLQADVRAMALKPLFTRIATDFAPQALAAGLAFRVVPTRLGIVSDPVLLERILRNLAANALRYTREGGLVIGARRHGRTVRIDVIDSGVGIAAGDQERIFEDFVQVGGTASASRRGHGLGLGLAIVRRLSGLLEHRLEVASVPGRGSRFSIVVPRAPHYRDRSPTELPRVAEPLEPAIDHAALRGRHVVVIDDDATVLSAMQTLFTTWGASVTAASTSRDATAAVRRANRSIDLIVADLRLAGGECGLDAIADVRNTAGRQVPALVVSGDTTHAARAEVAQAHVASLQKPVVAGDLHAAALKALAATAGANAASSGARAALAGTVSS